MPGLGTGFVAGSGCQSWDSFQGLSDWCGADALFRDKTTGRRMNVMQYQQQPENAVGYLFEFVGHPEDSNDKHSILHNKLREGFNTPEFALPERDLFERPEYSQQVPSQLPATLVLHTSNAVRCLPAVCLSLPYRHCPTLVLCRFIVTVPRCRSHCATVSRCLSHCAAVSRCPSHCICVTASLSLCRCVTVPLSLYLSHCLRIWIWSKNQKTNGCWWGERAVAPLSILIQMGLAHGTLCCVAPSSGHWCPPV